MADPPVELRSLSPELAPTVFDAVSDPALYEHLDEAPPASAEALCDRYRFLVRGAPPERREVWLNFFIEHQGDLVGTVQATIPAEGPTSVAYVIFRAWQGNGFATAATRLLLEKLRRRGVGQVQVEIAPANVASLAVARHLGFEPADELDGDIVLRRTLS